MDKETFNIVFRQQVQNRSKQKYDLEKPISTYIGGSLLNAIAFLCCIECVLKKTTSTFEFVFDSTDDLKKDLDVMTTQQFQNYIWKQSIK